MESCRATWFMGNEKYISVIFLKIWSKGLRTSGLEETDQMRLLTCWGGWLKGKCSWIATAGFPWVMWLPFSASLNRVGSADMSHKTNCRRKDKHGPSCRSCKGWGLRGNGGSCELVNSFYSAFLFLLFTWGSEPICKDQHTFCIKSHIINSFCSLGSYSVCLNYSTLPLWWESSHRQYKNEWRGPCSNKTLFTISGSG